MKIVKFKAHNNGPFSNSWVRFCPGVNIVRGMNGIGKTTLLEYASLLGHVAVMKPNKHMGNGQLEMVVRFASTDIKFLRDLSSRDASLNADRAFIAALGAQNLTLARVCEAVEALDTDDALNGEWIVKFFYPSIYEEDLKSVLADEGKIANEVSFSGDENLLIALKAINIWVRPTGPKETGPWPATPRLIEDLCTALANKPRPTPGAVFYFNTDMYEFGSGLDVRESPKHLKENMTQVLLNRLQLVKCNPDATPIGANLSEGFVQDTSAESLICISRLMDCDEGSGLQGGNKGAWDRVFTDHKLTSASVKRLLNEGDSESKVTPKFQWQFKIGDRPQNSEFLSSGENQALFTLAVLYGLASDGSCMLFDEPELHLTFGAGSRLLDQILKRARETESQAIIVTHLPHLYRDRVLRKGWTWDGFCNDKWYDKLQMIFIERGPNLTYETEGVNNAAQSSHGDVMTLINGLKLSPEDEVRMLPTWLSTLLKFFKPAPPTSEPAKD